jgi:hypothetical protein
MLDFLITILILYGVAVVTVTATSLLFLGDMKVCLLTPSEIYENTNLNWFGCVFVWFLEFIINPVMWICITIVKIIKWLFAVGR